MLLVSYIQQYCQYFQHSSDKSGLKVADCTFQSAEYWCSYGTGFDKSYCPIKEKKSLRNLNY